VSLSYDVSFSLNNTLFGFFGPMDRAFGHINHHALDFPGSSGERFLAREFKGFILAQNVLYPLDGLAYGAFARLVISPG
jgi:hypothetical protein